jgi:hypothetical protein
MVERRRTAHRWSVIKIDAVFETSRFSMPSSRVAALFAELRLFCFPAELIPVCDTGAFL